MNKIIFIIVFLLSAQSAHAASLTRAPNNLGLVGYWSFNEGTGLKASDFSGFGNTSTLTGGPTWTAGKLGGGLSFDGTNDYVATPAISLGTTHTTSAWVKFLSTGQNMGLFSGPFADYSYQFFFYSNGIYYARPGNAFTKIADYTHDVGVWHHFSMVRNGTAVSVYADGVLLGSATLGGNEATSLGAIGVHPDAYVGGYYFLGNIDEARAYNRALGTTEIVRLYQAGQARVQGASSESNTGLVGHWRFDDATGNSAVDSSSRGSTGTLTGGPKWTAGRLKGGLLLDTTDDHVVLPSGAGFSSAQDHAYASWVYPTSLAGSYIWLVDYGGGSGTTGSSLILYSATDVPGFFYAGGSSFVVGTRVIPLNQWSHIVASYNSVTNKVTFYVNGTLDTETATLGAWTSPAASAHYIGRWFNGSYNFLGSMDDVRVYNRVLTAEQVRSLYSSGTTRPRIVNQSSSTLTQGTSLASGLVGHWTFDGAHMTGIGGVGTAKDVSGSGNHGTLTNSPTPTLGKMGQALSFDGVNDHISVPEISLGTTHSVAAWVKIREVRANGIFSGSFADANYFLLIHSNGNVYYALPGYGYYIIAGAGGYPVLNQWAHVAVVRSGTSVTYYLNGVAPGAAATLGANTAVSLSLLGNSPNGDNPANAYTWGLIDDMRVYNRALSATEVKQLYNLAR